MVLIVFNIIKNPYKLKVLLDTKDLKALNITYNEINYNNINTKKIITDILERAKIETGFDSYGKVLLMEIFPSDDDGCIMYFSLLKDEKRTYRKTLNSFCFEYDSIESLIKSINLAFKIYGYRMFKSSLYKQNKTYILNVEIGDKKDEKITYLLEEFSYLKNNNAIYTLFADEHFDLIIKDNAMEVLYKYFN